MSNPNIGFLGAGHLAQSILEGLLTDNSPFNCQNIIASCKTKKTSDLIKERFKIDCRTDNQWLINNSDYVILAVKPSQLTSVLTSIDFKKTKTKLMISLLAGFQINDYQIDIPLIRAMPNIASSVQASLTGLYSDFDLDEKTNNFIEQIFSQIGGIIWLEDEIQVDGLIALSASGISYFLYLMQKMLEIGEGYGFEKEQLFDILSLTALGAATITTEKPAQDFNNLIKQIAVKGGTTEQALAQFDQHNFKKILTDAMDSVIKQNQKIRQTNFSSQKS